MDVHPVLSSEILKSRHLQLPRSGPDGQPVESSHLERLPGRHGLLARGRLNPNGMTDTALQPDLPAESASAGHVDSSPAKADAGGILTINLSAITANWELLGRQAMPSECAAVIKADGYGCGIEPVARTLTHAGCRTFFVADLSEARRARAAAPNSALYVLNGLL